MRVAIVALSCHGGMRHYTSQLANSLARHADVHVFAPADLEQEAYFSGEITLHGIRPLSFSGQAWRGILTQMNPWVHAVNAQRIRRIQPDIVHVVTPHPSNGLTLPLLGEIPVCYTMHDPSVHPGEVSPVRDFLTRRAVGIADHLIVHGEALRVELEEQGLCSSRISVIPHGDYGFFLKYAEGRPEEPLILFFGRLIAYKGLEVLCQAERRLAERLDGYSLCIAGEGDPGIFSAEMGPSGRVTVENRYLSDSEVAALFERARIVVLPYTQASQSGVLAIAFAFGKPVIVTRTGGLPEAVGEGEAGLIVPPGDPEALAEAMERLWRDPSLRAQLAEAGRRRVAEQIGWPIIAQRHLELYRKLLERAGRAGASEPGFSLRWG